MIKAKADRAKRRRRFLSALAAGVPVAQACDLSHVAYSTAYHWRRTDPPFRAAWDAAEKAGEEAMMGRFKSELVRRAIDGVDEPVFHNGEAVATRKRYSDPLLMFGFREMRGQRQPAAPPTAPLLTHTPRVTVVLQPLGRHGERDE